MSDRIKKNWKVIRSFENDSHHFCVDIFIREDNTFGFEEFRRDPEDIGAWTGMKYYSVMTFDNEQALYTAIKENVSWFEQS